MSPRPGKCRRKVSVQLKCQVNGQKMIHFPCAQTSNGIEYQHSRTHSRTKSQLAVMIVTFTCPPFVIEQPNRFRSKSPHYVLIRSAVKKSVKRLFFSGTAVRIFFPPGRQLFQFHRRHRSASAEFIFTLGRIKPQRINIHLLKGSLSCHFFKKLKHTAT